MTTPFTPAVSRQSHAVRQMPRLAKLLAAAGALVLATGCAGLRSMDVDVTSFASWPNGVVAAPGSTFRFERLPSQQVTAVQRDRLETLTREALGRKGLQLSPTLAQYSVQATVNTQLVSDGYATGYPGGPNIGLSTGIFSGGGGGGFGGISFGFPLGGAGTGSSGYRIELVLLMRSLQTNAVVFESRAYALMPSGEDPAVLSGLLDSALRGFPVPVAGTQRYRIDLAAPPR
ncbi:MAG: DUF4136 domain-containing protein [Haliea sp.]|nr:MAG: DUF4136 domain-containing protein [Haliea sp.]